MCESSATNSLSFIEFIPKNVQLAPPKLAATETTTIQGYIGPSTSTPIIPEEIPPLPKVCKPPRGFEHVKPNQNNFFTSNTVSSNRGVTRVNNFNFPVPYQQYSAAYGYPNPYNCFPNVTNYNNPMCYNTSYAQFYSSYRAPPGYAAPTYYGGLMPPPGMVNPVGMYQKWSDTLCMNQNVQARQNAAAAANSFVVSTPTFFRNNNLSSVPIVRQDGQDSLQTVASSSACAKFSEQATPRSCQTNNQSNDVPRLVESVCQNNVENPTVDAKRLLDQDRNISPQSSSGESELAPLVHPSTEEDEVVAEYWKNLRASRIAVKTNVDKVPVQEDTKVQKNVAKGSREKEEKLVISKEAKCIDCCRHQNSVKTKKKKKKEVCKNCIKIAEQLKNMQLKKKKKLKDKDEANEHRETCTISNVVESCIKKLDEKEKSVADHVGNGNRNEGKGGAELCSDIKKCNKKNKSMADNVRNVKKINEKENTEPCKNNDSCVKKTDKKENKAAKNVGNDMKRTGKKCKENTSVDKDIKRCDIKEKTVTENIGTIKKNQGKENTKPRNKNNNADKCVKGELKENNAAESVRNDIDEAKECTGTCREDNIVDMDIKKIDIKKENVTKKVVDIKKNDGKDYSELYKETNNADSCINKTDEKEESVAVNVTNDEKDEVEASPELCKKDHSVNLDRDATPCDIKGENMVEYVRNEERDEGNKNTELCEENNILESLSDTEIKDVMNATQEAKESALQETKPSGELPVSNVDISQECYETKNNSDEAVVGLDFSVKYVSQELCDLDIANVSKENHVTVDSIRHVESHLPCEDVKKEFVMKAQKDICDNSIVPELAFDNLNNGQNAIEVLNMKEQDEAPAEEIASESDKKDAANLIHVPKDMLLIDLDIEELESTLSSSSPRPDAPTLPWFSSSASLLLPTKCGSLESKSNNKQEDIAVKIEEIVKPVLVENITENDLRKTMIKNEHEKHVVETGLSKIIVFLMVFFIYFCFSIGRENNTLDMLERPVLCRR